MQLCINNRRDYFENLIKKKAYNSLLLIFFFMFHYFFSPLSILRVKEISLYFICLTIVRFCEAPIFTLNWTFECFITFWVPQVIQLGRLSYYKPARLQEADRCHGSADCPNLPRLIKFFKFKTNVLFSTFIANCNMRHRKK